MWRAFAEFASVGQHPPDDACQMVGDDDQGIRVVFATVAMFLIDTMETGMFASDDEHDANMRAIAEEGLRVPDDIAIVGFDNVRYAADLDLTTVAQPAFETGKTAAEILIRQIENRDAGASEQEFQQVVLPTRLVVRGSCGGREL